MTVAMTPRDETMADEVKSFNLTTSFNNVSSSSKDLPLIQPDPRSVRFINQYQRYNAPSSHLKSDDSISHGDSDGWCVGTERIEQSDVHYHYDSIGTSKFERIPQIIALRKYSTTTHHQSANDEDIPMQNEDIPMQNEDIQMQDEDTPMHNTKNGGASKSAILESRIASQKASLSTPIVEQPTAITYQTSSTQSYDMSLRLRKQSTKPLETSLVTSSNFSYPIYSLTNCKIEPFLYNSSLFWLHLFSSILKIFSSAALLIFNITISITGHNTGGSGWTQQFRLIMMIVNIILTLIFTLILVGYGIHTFIFLLYIRKSYFRWSKKYRIESIGSRVCMLISLTYVGWTVTFFLSMRSAYCNELKEPILEDLKKPCREAYLIWIAFGIALMGVVGSSLTTFTWIGKWFKTYTAISYLRFAFGVIVLALAVAAAIVFQNLKAGPLGLNDAQYDAQVQYSSMTALTVALGCCAGALNIITAIFSLISGWMRSKLLVGIDAIVLFIIFWFLLQFGFSLSWPLDIFDYLSNYESLYGHSNRALKALVSSGIRAGLIITIIFILLSAILVCISFVLILLALYKYCPREWSIQKRLLTASLTRTRSRRRSTSVQQEKGRHSI